MRKFCLSSVLLIAAVASGETKTVQMLPSEEWYGAATYFGPEMPFTEKTELAIDIRVNGWANQYASLLLSNQGRMIWCDRQAGFVFSGGCISVTADADIVVEKVGNDLRSAFRHASATYFPPSGMHPDALFFSAPQYNTWIELTYNQNEKDVLAYAQSMLDNGLPPGVLMIDDTWQTAYGDWDFDRRRFAAPKEMVCRLHQLGFKVILWICPWVGLDTPAYRLLTTGIDPFSEARKVVGGLLLEADGKAPAVVKWWNGRSALLDFTHPCGRSWFKGQLDRLVADYGVDGFKLDGGALNYYTSGYRAYDNLPSGDQANGFAAFALQYPVCEYRHAWKLGGQPIVERLHDKNHSWKDLRALIPSLVAAGLLGHSFVCPDMIGGGEWHSFLPGASFDPELFVRSAQVHALCGQMQFSASPWRILSADYQDIVKKAVAIRQKFADHFVSMAAECGRSGEPMLRSMDYMFPGNGYGTIKDQFMMGDFLMVAPQVTKGATARSVAIPPGRWKGDDGSVVTGPTKVVVETPLSRLPHFIRQCQGPGDGRNAFSVR